MNIWGVAVAFAIAAAGFHGVAAVVQNQLAGDRRAALSRRLGTLGIVSQRRWWLAVGLTTTASGLHVTALHFGPLTVVQPLGVLSLAFALTLSAVLVGRRVTRTEWRGLAMSMAGLGCLVLLTSPGRPRNALSPAEVTTLTVITVAVVATVVIAASRTPRPVRRSLLYAAAAGMTFGVSSALTQTVTIRVADAGSHAALTPAAGVVIAFAVGGLLLAQTAYRGGLGAPLATATIVNPVTAAAIGIGLLGERFTGGPIAVTLAVVAASGAACGVVLLTKGSRPVVTPAAAAEPVSVRS